MLGTTQYGNESKDEKNTFLATSHFVWCLSDRQYRRECLRAMGSDVREELDFMDKFAEDNPKNYQIWYHRRAVVEMAGVADREIAFCNKVFAVDAKNYHAWAHRYLLYVSVEYCVC